MDEEQEGFWVCVFGILELIGLIIVLIWPILLLFLSYWSGILWVGIDKNTPFKTDNSF